MKRKDYSSYLIIDLIIIVLKARIDSLGMSVGKTDPFIM